MMNDLAISKVENWAFRFTVMLTLSVVVAVMGLSLNSAAVVIGAMLLAPLMQPVLASGATLSMALFNRSLLSLAKVAAATAWCIAISYLLWKILPQQDLTTEIEARTQPDIKDLVVALAAGAAGSYATVREDASSSLPGVAVAVALVPPLAAVGITLEQGDYKLALGALLLYTTNLAAIIFVSILVFVATGFVPPRRLANKLVRLIAASVVVAAAVAIISAQLYQTSLDTIEQNENKRMAEDVVAEWLGASDENLDQIVDFKPDKNDGPPTIVVGLRGFERPPDQGTLEVRLQEQFEGAVVLVEWIRVEAATTTTTTLPPLEERERLQLVDEADAIVETWLADSGLSDSSYFEGVFISETAPGSIVQVDIAGSGEPPDVNDLNDRFADGLSVPLVPRLNWTERAVVNVGDDTPTPLEDQQLRMLEVAEVWADRRNLLLESFDFDGERVEIAVAGNQQPLIAVLENNLQEIAEDDIPVRVYFTARRLVTTTVPLEIPLVTR